MIHRGDLVKLGRDAEPGVPGSLGLSGDGAGRNKGAGQLRVHGNSPTQERLLATNCPLYGQKPRGEATGTLSPMAGDARTGVPAPLSCWENAFPAQVVYPLRTNCCVLLHQSINCGYL